MAPAWAAGDRKACTSPSGGACAGLLDEKFERGLPVQRNRLDELLYQPAEMLTLLGLHDHGVI